MIPPEDKLRIVLSVLAGELSVARRDARFASLALRFA